MESMRRIICLLAVFLYLPDGTQSETLITKMVINSNVSVRFADVNVTSSVFNNGKKGEETNFELQMPVTAFITRFAIILNGEEFLAEIEDRNKANEIYNTAKKNNLTTGLITQQANLNEDIDIEVFKVRVFIPAGALVDFHLQYQELLQRRRGFYSQRIYIRPKQIVPEISIFCYYNEPQGFKSFTYKMPTTDKNEINVEVTEFTRKLDYTPSEQSQSSISPFRGVDGELQVEYDVHHEVDGGLVLENGDYFAHYFSPECEDDLIMSKRIIFIIDKSGSMKVSKIYHVKTALKAILSQLRSTDHFNLITFNENIFTWRKAAVEASSNNIEDAVGYIDESISADGATNINEALLRGIRMFKDEPEDTKNNIIVFLTDGEATKGVTSTSLIRELVFSENTNGNTRYASIFSLSFGDQTKADFLKRLAWGNGGDYRALRSDNEASEILLGFFEEVQNPYLQDIRFEYNGENNVELPITVTRTQFPQYFCGSELVVSGQIETGTSESEIESTASSFSPRVYANNNNDNIEFKANRRIESTGSQNSVFLSRLYIYQQIKDLLKRAEVETGLDESLRNELNARALNLSLTYGFVTKLTSLVVRSVKAKEMRSADRSLSAVRTRSGYSGFAADYDFTSTDASTPVYVSPYYNGQINYKPSLQNVLFFMSISVFLFFLYQK